MMKSNQAHFQVSEERVLSPDREQQTRLTRQPALHLPSLHLPSRRKILMGGLAVGATLAAGGVLATRKITSLQQAKNGADGHLRLNLAWDGDDFVWLPDSTHLAYGGKRGLFHVDTGDGQQIWKQKVWPNSTYTQTQTVICSANCTTFAYLAQRALLVQDVESGRNLWTYQIPQPAPSTANDQPLMYTAALSPDGLYLAFAPATGDASVQIWNVRKGQLAAQYTVQAGDKHPAGISSIIWSPDGRQIVVTGRDDSVQMRYSLEDRIVWSYQDQPGAAAISWSPDGSTIAFAAPGNGGQTQSGVWNASSGRTGFLTPADIGYPTDQSKQDNSIAWSPDGKRIAFKAIEHNRAVIDVWSVSDERRLFTCRGAAGQLNSIAWSPDGRYLAAGDYIAASGELERGDNGDRSVIRFWDAQNGNALFTYKAPKNPDHLSWSPNSRYLAIITPTTYDVLPQTSCLSMCRYGYANNALQVFQVG